MPGAWAGVIAAGVSAVGSIAGGALASGATSSGASQANALSEKTIQEGRDNYTRDRATYQPFVDQGTGAVNQTGNLLGLNGPDAAAEAMKGFTASPGFGYSLQQGLRGVDAGAASKGMLRSGATLKAEQTLGSNLATQDFGNYLTRLNTLSGLGLQGSLGQANTTSTFNSLLTGQSSGQQQTLTSAAGQDASIYGNTAQGLTNAVGLANKNGLFDGWGSEGSVGTSGYGGAGGTNSVGANELQGMGFYNPLPA